MPFTPQNMTFQHAKGHVLETQKTLNRLRS